MTDCKAVYHHDNDEHTCTRCGCSWDRGDEKPECKTNDQLGHETLDKLKAEVRDV
jgi:hypothetical protein